MHIFLPKLSHVTSIGMYKLLFLHSAINIAINGQFSLVLIVSLVFFLFCLSGFLYGRYMNDFAFFTKYFLYFGEFTHSEYYVSR